MAEGMKVCKTVVVSAVNFTEGGPLTVLRDSLASAVEVLPPDWRIIAIVHNADLISLPRVQTVAIPDAKAMWWRRLYWEWFGFRHLSLEWKPEFWLSLHDMTPRVYAHHQAVYCHNPAPFYRVRPHEVLQEPKLLLFSLLYAFLYRINIRRNRFVVVQQEWLRQEFLRRFGLLPMVVAHPAQDLSPTRGKMKQVTHYVFLYPALPRVFKNFEIIGDAVNLLQVRGIQNFEVRLTIDGSENRYARWLKQRYGQFSNLRFIGRQDQNQMLEQYKEASALLFPSRLETWGLPITEAKQHRLPMLVADLPYAHETVGEYDLVSFFDTHSPQLLSHLMESMIIGAWQPTCNHQHPPDRPFASNWGELWAMLVDNQTYLRSSDTPTM